MGRWRDIADWFGLPTRSLKFDSPPQPIDRVILEMRTGNPGHIGKAQAMSVPAVLKGRNMICAVATLPLQQVDAENRPAPLSLLTQIDPDVPNVVTLAQTLEDLLFESVSWWRITAFGSDDYPTSARHLDFSSVSLNPPPGQNLAPLPGEYDPRNAVVWVDGMETPADQMIRFDSPNPPFLRAGAKSIRRALLLNGAASTYADDPRPQDYFTPADGADPAEDDEIVGILDKWRKSRKERSTGYVPAALKYNTVDQPSPADLQLVELQKQVTLDIANALGVDPEDLGVSTTSRTYANAVDRRRDRINDVLSPYMQAITGRLSMGDVTKRGYSVRFDLDDYLRADPTTRWNNYKAAKDMGAITVQEIRLEEGMPETPLAGTLESQAPAASRPPLAAVPSLTASFAADQPGYTFADIPVSDLTVDVARRIIRGRALPYGETGIKGGRKFRFAPGSLRWAEMSRIKMLRDHDRAQAIGVAIELTDAPGGFDVAFKIARGEAGDRALALAEDKVLDGLSVGVDVVDAVADPLNRGGFLVNVADLREVTLTAMPAFDSARVTSVAASRTEGVTMDPCSTCGQVHAESVACTAPTASPANQPTDHGGLSLSQDQAALLLSRPGALQALMTPPAPAEPETPAGALTLSQDQVDALIRGGGLATLLGVPQLIPAPAAEPEKRQTVDPTRPTGAAVFVREEEGPYRFDRSGHLTRGKFDFSSDLIAGSQGDGVAFKRAEDFMRAQFQREEDQDRPTRAEFVNKADAATLNPNIQRPDLYVDQKEFEYPVWNAINKGTIADATPFVLPKFNTSSGLVAAHVENTEPTPGTFTATAQTITPSAVSGKVEISREAWDQGGNPQLSGLIWTQMQRAWFEALEASAVAELDAATPTGITITALAQDAALEASLTSQLSPLQYIRGGFRMRDFFIQVDLYKALIAAKDTAGRKLFPVLGAQNATGTTSDFFSAVLVAGLVGRPAWALAATGIVPASSYLFDRKDVSGWATAPQRLTFENCSVAKVHVGIWGYKATAITDLTGVREVIYDPA